MDEELKSEVSLKDGGHKYLYCSACNEQLVDIWVTKPEENVKFKMRATCGYCDDKSFSEIVEGAFHLGVTERSTISRIESLDSDEDVLNGNINGSYLIYTIKDTKESKKR